MRQIIVVFLLSLSLIMFAQMMLGAHNHKEAYMITNCDAFGYSNMRVNFELALRDVSDTC